MYKVVIKIFFLLYERITLLLWQLYAKIKFKDIWELKEYLRLSTKCKGGGEKKKNCNLFTIQHFRDMEVGLGVNVN